MFSGPCTSAEARLRSLEQQRLSSMIHRGLERLTEFALQADPVEAEPPANGTGPIFGSLALNAAFDAVVVSGERRDAEDDTRLQAEIDRETGIDEMRLLGPPALHAQNLAVGLPAPALADAERRMWHLHKQLLAADDSLRAVRARMDEETAAESKRIWDMPSPPREVTRSGSPRLGFPSTPSGRSLTAVPMPQRSPAPSVSLRSPSDGNARPPSLNANARALSIQSATSAVGFSPAVRR